jgi:hypothetical protein
MISLVHDPETVQTPHAIRIVRDPEPIRTERDEETDLERAGLADVPTWLEGQQRYHEFYSHAEGDIRDLVATTINDLRCVWVHLRPTSPRDLVSRPGHLYSRVNLDCVPLGSRESAPAQELDAIAEYYVDQGSDLCLLVAAAILQRADEIEESGAQSLGEYWRIEERRIEEAAWWNAVEDTYASLENPTW